MIRRSSVKAFNVSCKYGPPVTPPSPTISLQNINQVVRDTVVNATGVMRFVKNYFAAPMTRGAYATFADPHFGIFSGF